MSLGFLSPKPDTTIIRQEPPPTTESEGVIAAVQRERRRRAKRQGFASTILTSGQGVLGAAPTSGTTLLGS